MNKSIKKNSQSKPLKPIIPRTQPSDGAYLDTLKQLQEEREKAD